MGTCLFSLRQLFYAIRPILIRTFGTEPDYKHFSRIIGEFEDDNGEIENLYRDDRGVLYHPHSKESINLGTRSVSMYERPTFGFNKVLYCEKEGFFSILIQHGWPERHDCALMTAKGFATRAARDLLRKIESTGEPLTVFCAHDADGPGTLIFESFANILKPHGIIVINLGLDPDEGREMGLQSESCERKNGQRVPVADYLSESDQAWLQSNRIELNAMTSPQFIEWLTRKVAEHDTGKVVPPVDVVHTQLQNDMICEVERILTEKVLKEAGIPARVKEEMKKHHDAIEAAQNELDQALPQILLDDPHAHWTRVVRRRAIEIVSPSNSTRSRLNRRSGRGK